ncbi:MAG: Mu transposase C-terminal domain-containing protein, partial [Sneathiella sp.]
IRYASFELKKYLERAGVRNKVQIRFDPHDIREIAVWDEYAEEHFYVTTKIQGCPALSFAEVDQARKALRPPDHEELEIQSILAEMKIYEDFKVKDEKRTSKQKQKALAIAGTRNKEIIEQSKFKAGTNPYDAAQPKHVKPKLTLPENMPETTKRRPN